MDAQDHDLLALGSLAFRGRSVSGAALESLEPAFGHGQVGQHEFEVEALEVPRGVDAAFGMRVGRILECPDHVEQGIRVAQPGEVIGGQLFRADVALGRRRRRRHVHVGDVGLDDLLRLEDGREGVEARVGHLDHPDVEGHPAVAAGLGVASGERVEDGGLAGSGQTDDGDLHRAIVAGISTRRQDPRCSAAARRSRSAAGCRRTARRCGPGRARWTRPCAG